MPFHFNDVCLLTFLVSHLFLFMLPNNLGDFFISILEFTSFLLTYALLNLYIVFWNFISRKYIWFVLIMFCPYNTYMLVLECFFKHNYFILDIIISESVSENFLFIWSPFKFCFISIVSWSWSLFSFVFSLWAEYILWIERIFFWEDFHLLLSDNNW